MLFASLVPLPVAADVRASVPSLVLQAGSFTKVILALLFLMSVGSWAVMWERIRLLRRVSKADAAFGQAFRAGRGLAETRMLAAQHPESVLARLASAGLSLLSDRGREGFRIDLASIELASRAMQRARVNEMDRLERHLSFLATTGSVAPFLGLMGTVWGVMQSFLNIGVQGSASLIVVAPGIAEALIATLAGLAAAIPAVIGYNHLVARVRSIDNLAMAFVSEFADAALHEPRAEEARARAPREPLAREAGL